MGLFDILAVLLTLSAVFSFLNYRYIRLPTTVGVMLIALVASLALMVLHRLGLNFEDDARVLLASIDFDEAVLQGILSFLLFAGALHVELGDLAKQKWVIGILATLSVVASTVLVGFLAWWLFNLLGVPMPLPWALVFGALISPTDPIAVLGILKRLKAPKALETKIAGESLFNDGVGVVVFLLLVGLATGSEEASAVSTAWLFTQEVAGGAVWGALLGIGAYWMLRQVDDYHVEILITLALVTGGYALALALHLSGPIAMVVAGLLVGNHGRLLAMSETTRDHLDTFWELVDEILNVVLFVLIGLEVLVLTLDSAYFAVAVLLIPGVLLARFLAVGTPLALLRRRAGLPAYTIRVLVWGGLRGGISVALALSLPPGPIREAILVATYVVVVFSIVVQGTTVGRLVRRASSTGEKT